MRNRTAVLAIMAALLPAPAVLAGADEGRAVASPELVAAAGFPPGTTLYVAAPAAEDPSPYFGASSAFTVHAGNSVHGRQSTFAYGTSTGQGDISYSSGDNFADARLEFPSGVVLESVRWWANDTLATDITFFLLQSCLPAAGPGLPVSTLLGQGATTGTGGGQSGVFAAAANTVVDNNTCQYYIRSSFGGAGLVLQRLRVQWRRQVSAAPAVASFNDVPTGHFAFRFVEALAASGITGGCGAGTYCPDSPVTRAQMAIFLATALGLHFPN